VVSGPGNASSPHARWPVKYMLALLSSLSLFGQTVTVDVEFKLTETGSSDHRLAGVPVRLVLVPGAIGKLERWPALRYRRSGRKLNSRLPVSWTVVGK